MRSKFNELTGLWEQVSSDVLPQDVDTNVIEQKPPVENAPVIGGDTGKLHGFIIDSGNIAAINQVASGKVNEYKAEIPLKVLGKDGSIGAEAMMGGKPLYLMIKTYKSKSERASSDAQLEESDRIYLLFNTSATELSSIINEANSIEDRINIAANDPKGKEHTVSIWKGDVGTQPNPTNTTDTTLNMDNANVNVDMQAQIENPGTAAGISGTVQENKKHKNMKTNKINEQVPFNVADNTLVNNQYKINTPDYFQNTKSNTRNLTTSQQAVLKSLGKAASEITLNDGTYVVKLPLSKDNTGIDGIAYFYSNNRMYIKTKDGNKIIAKATYKDGGKTITLDGKPAIAEGNVYGNLKSIAKSVNKSTTKSTDTKISSAFKTQEEGDAFRTWANSTPELTAKYGKTSKYDLDTKGKFNNSFINKAYAAAKDEYIKSKDKPVETNFKYKEGDIVYYRVNKEGKAEQVDAGTNTAEIDKQKAEMAKATKGNQELYKTGGANPRISEAIVTNFNTFRSILEDDENADVDKIAELMKDFKEGNVKKGKVIKQVDNETIQLINTTSDKEATVKVSDLIDTESAKKAALKIKADKEAEEAAKAAKEAEANKSDVAGAKDKLKDARDEKKDAKQKLRDTKKTKRKNTRIEKVNKKTDEINKKTDSINTSESVVYSFDEFIKKVNKLN